MSGFCGHCGRPRGGNEIFCGGCGNKFTPPMQPCPTCGQPWPGPQPSAGVAAETRGSNRTDESAPRGPEEGPEFDPSTDCENCGFDGPNETETCAHCGRFKLSAGEDI